MTKLAPGENLHQNWLDWCRLCASEEAAVNVRQKDVYMRIISKCFDVEIEFEQPQLGGMLCIDCFSLISELINFTENVNKAQPIFEILRHTEPHERLDVTALRVEYGLQEKTSIKTEISHEDSLNSLETSVEFESQLWNIEGYSPDEKSNSPTPSSSEQHFRYSKGTKTIRILNKTTRPKHNFTESNLKRKSSTDWQEDQCEEGERNDTWLLDSEDEEEPVKRPTPKKRGRPRKGRTIAEEKVVPDEKIETQSSIKERNSSIDSVDQTLDQRFCNDEDVNEEGNVVAEEIIEKPAKRKRGRPRKNATTVNVNVNDKISPKHKNDALSRLLSSPKPFNKDRNASPVNCPVCNKELASENGLKVHIENVHDKKKPYICDICGKGVPTTSALKEHMLVHTDEKPFICPICKAGFKNQKRLNVHSQTHGAPRYECNICGKKLQTRAIWHKHKYVHNNVRRFVCGICGTATKHSTALKVHLLSHTGFRPFVCKYCNKSFASGSNCRDHKMKHHPVEYANDDDKSSRVASVPTLDELRAIADSMEKGARLRKPKSCKAK